MNTSADFDSIEELETAFRALVLFKFGGSNDADIYLGSPAMARAVTSMLTSIRRHWDSHGDPHRAAHWHDVYQGPNVERHVELISDYAVRHPKWATMPPHERLEWLQIIAAPYRLDDTGLHLFEPLLSDT